MGEIKSFITWFTNLSNTKKLTAGYLLVIIGLVYLNYKTKKEDAQKYDELRNDYLILGNRYNTLFDNSQKEINILHKEKEKIIQTYSDKFEILFRESQFIKKKVE